MQKRKFWARHQEEDRARIVSENKILSWAADLGFKGTVDECVKFLNQIDMDIWEE